MFSFIAQKCFIYYLVDVFPFFLIDHFYLWYETIIVFFKLRDKNVLYKKLTTKCTISNYEYRKVYNRH